MIGSEIEVSRIYKQTWNNFKGDDTLRLDAEEFKTWLNSIPEPERKKYSLDFLATLFAVEKILETIYGEVWK